MGTRELSRRVDKLERRSGSGLTIIVGRKGESEAEARQRYETEHERGIEGLVIYLNWKDAAA